MRMHTVHTWVVTALLVFVMVWCWVYRNEELRNVPRTVEVSVKDVPGNPWSLTRVAGPDWESTSVVASDVLMSYDAQGLLVISVSYSHPHEILVTARKPENDRMVNEDEER